MEWLFIWFFITFASWEDHCPAEWTFLAEDAGPVFDFRPHLFPSICYEV